MFKKIKRRAVRQPIAEENSNSDDDTAEVGATLEEMKELQGLRKRAIGIDVEKLGKGEKRKKETKNTDAYDITTGGMMDMKQLLKPTEDVDDAYDTGIGTTFSAETNRRDEDAEMQKYIDEEMSKRKGTADADDADKNRYTSPEEAALMAVPEHLRISSNKKSEEMLSNQMLSGIPEVDLGIETKIRNIEATEAAKMQLLADQKKRNETPSEFVPTNMAVNFRHHNRFSVRAPNRRAGPSKPAESSDPPKPLLVVGGVRAEETKKADKAASRQGQPSDDACYNRFKNQFWR